MIVGMLTRTIKLATLAGAAWYVAKKMRRRMHSADLAGRVVLITGGSRGLGLALARELAARGARIAICARKAEHLENTQQEFAVYDYPMFTCQADVTVPDQVNEMMEKVVQHYGRLDMVINNAGTMLLGPEQVMSIADYKNIMEANCWSALYTTKAATPYFKAQGGGYIVNICSIGGKISVPHMLPYSVSKFAMVGLSQGLASELDRDNIVVTTVIPNLMRTGSPRNIDIKGNHRAEYAWFKLANAFPLLSQGAETAAKRIVDGIARRDREITLSLTAKLAIALQALAPELISAGTRLAGRVMPASNDTTVKKGYESESVVTRGVTGGKKNADTVKFNQQ